MIRSFTPKAFAAEVPLPSKTSPPFVIPSLSRAELDETPLTDAANLFHHERHEPHESDGRKKAQTSAKVFTERPSLDALAG